VRLPDATSEEIVQVLIRLDGSEYLGWDHLPTDLHQGCLAEIHQVVQQAA